MDDEGFAFTPLTFLLLVPVMILAISYNGIINEVNTISAIAIGGDVTINIANNINTIIDEDTGDAGRTSALDAVELVINNTNLLYGNDPFFNTTGSNTSYNYITSNTQNMLGSNITNTCITLENQTDRTILINNIPVDNSTSSSVISNSLNLTISQNDPYGFYINVNQLNITVVQNGSQSVTLKTPADSVYVSIIGLEDPYIWVNTKERNSSVIYAYPYYTNPNSLTNVLTNNDYYHFADSVSNGSLQNLNVELMGSSADNYTVPYYFPDQNGLSFFDRLEDTFNSTNGNSKENNTTCMSTFIIYDVLSEEHKNNPTSMIDHEYFAGISGNTITAKGSIVPTPGGMDFLISSNYLSILGLNSSY